MCVCKQSCPSKVVPVCGDDGYTYENKCFLDKKACENNRKIKILHSGICFLLTIKPGRSILVFFLFYSFRQALTSICIHRMPKNLVRYNCVTTIDRIRTWTVLVRTLVGLPEKFACLQMDLVARYKISKVAELGDIKGTCYIQECRVRDPGNMEYARLSLACSDPGRQAKYNARATCLLVQPQLNSSRHTAQSFPPVLTFFCFSYVEPSLCSPIMTNII